MLVHIIIFLAIISVLVLVHEWGHFITAKRAGMRVDEFALGFPPRLWSITRGGTEYALNLIPIGGYVRIYGENAEDAAADAAEGGDTAGAFTSKSRWAQAIVLLAGVVMNVILAWVLFVAVFMIGVATTVPDGAHTPGAHMMITQVLQQGPAMQAGIPVGATVTKLAAANDTITAVTPSNFSDFTDAHSKTPIKVTYTLGTQTYTKTVTPKPGLIPDDPSRAAIGVAVSYIAVQSQSFPQAVVSATQMTGQMIGTIFSTLGQLVWRSFHGTANFSQVAGPLGIYVMVGEAAHFGVTNVIMFAGEISLALAAMNVLPFPALDGGRLLFVLIEAIRRRPLDPIWVARVNGAGFLLLMVLLVAVTYHDIHQFFLG